MSGPESTHLLSNPLEYTTSLVFFSASAGPKSQIRARCLPFYPQGGEMYGSSPPYAAPLYGGANNSAHGAYANHVLAGARAEDPPPAAGTEAGDKEAHLTFPLIIMGVGSLLVLCGSLGNACRSSLRRWRGSPPYNWFREVSELEDGAPQTLGSSQP